jgi:hypothetical protein
MLLQDCVRQTPQRASYHYHLGMVLVAVGNGQKAKAELGTALRLKLSGDDAQHAREALAKIE